MLYVIYKTLNTDLAKKKKKSSFTSILRYPRSPALPQLGFMSHSRLFSAYGWLGLRATKAKPETGI